MILYAIRHKLIVFVLCVLLGNFVFSMVKIDCGGRKEPNKKTTNFQQSLRALYSNRAEFAMTTQS